jgi:hypothetical protein
MTLFAGFEEVGGFRAVVMQRVFSALYSAHVEFWTCIALFVDKIVEYIRAPGYGTVLYKF